MITLFYSTRLKLYFLLYSNLIMKLIQNVYTLQMKFREILKFHTHIRIVSDIQHYRDECRGVRVDRNPRQRRRGRGSRVGFVAVG